MLLNIHNLSESLLSQTIKSYFYSCKRRTNSPQDEPCVRGCDAEVLLVDGFSEVCYMRKKSYLRQN